MSKGRVKRVYESKAKGTVKLMVDGQDGYVQAKGAVSDFPSGCEVEYELSGQSWGKTHEATSCVVVSEAAASPTPAGKTSNVATGIGNSYEDRETAKQFSIVTQHSQEHAITLVERLIAHGALPLPEDAKKKLKVYLEYYNKFVVSLTEQALPGSKPAATTAVVKKQPPVASEAEEGFDDEIAF